ncbi:MAG: EAL and HDOD domain-containing protein [Bryobacteraceae bacterium]
MDLFVARQPIFDSQQRVFAYELLFRAGMVNSFDGTEENTATSKVITAAFYSSEGEQLLGGKQAFINFPRALLTGDGASIIPPETAVIEVLETVAPDEHVVASCGELRSRGYRIALDDFVDTAAPYPLVPHAEYIKVDLRAASIAQQAAILDRYRGRVRFIAEKVETFEEFERAKSMGFTYFQGYFFSRPVITPIRQIPGFKLNYLQILREIHATEMNVTNLSALVAREPSLSYKLLRFVNSALFTHLHEIDSLEHAFLFIGEDGIRRWLSVVTLMDLTSDKPAELAVTALLRARFCELLAGAAGLGARAGALFLMGMVSVLDAMLGRPLDQLLDGLGLQAETQRVLLGEAAPQEPAARLWKLVLAYEAADWPQVVESAGALGVAIEALPPLYSSAVAWADETFRL